MSSIHHFLSAFREAQFDAVIRGARASQVDTDSVQSSVMPSNQTESDDVNADDKEDCTPKLAAAVDGRVAERSEGDFCRIRFLPIELPARPNTIIRISTCVIAESKKIFPFPTGELGT